jgi:molybdate/tungstate transport system permease protein
VAAEVVFFTPLSYYLARNRNLIAETLADIPASIPHPIIGIALVIIDSPFTTTGRFLTSIGINFFNSLLGMVVALTIISAPIYIKAMQPFFESMNRAPEDFALGLGASRLRTFVQVALPNSSRGILGASLIALSRAMSEFGSIAIVAYLVLQAPFGLSGATPASVLIYDFYSSNGLNAAVTASAVMIAVSLPIMVALRIANRRATI